MFRDICLNDFKENVIKIISNEYMLITAGNKDDFNMACAAWPELRDINKNEGWTIPLHSKLLYLDEAPINYHAALVIKNESDDSTDESKICLYLRATEEIPTGTELFGSTCFTINHTR